MQAGTWSKDPFVRVPISVGNLTFPPPSTTLAPENITDAFYDESDSFTSFQVVCIAVISGFFSFITILGNVMVMISFKLDKQLQTISNYFLFSLAVADFTIGCFSMPMFTVYTLVGYWPFSSLICDTWLAVDYLVSNASVMNLLIISFDRYFSVTRPLSYRVRRTTRKAAVMIFLAWLLSLVLWVPWIYAWPYIEGKRESETECVVQFIENNIAMNVLCAMVAFFLPVTVMCILYIRVWWETVKRQRDLVHLQAGKKPSSRRSDSSDEEYKVQHNLDKQTSLHNLYGINKVTGDGERPSLLSRITSLIGQVCSRKQSVNEDPHHCQQDPLMDRNTVYTTTQQNTPSSFVPEENGCEPVYTILIQLPNPKREKDPDSASIRILSETSLNDLSKSEKSLRYSMGAVNRLSTDSSLYSIPSPLRDRKHSIDRLSLDTRIVSKQYVRTIHNPAPVPSTTAASLPRKNKVKKASQEKRQERKAAKTLSAILIVFIVTWTPYNVLAVMKGLLNKEREDMLIPNSLWNFFYFLCYLNSTINPFCYALCNAAFRRTYMRILTCKWSGNKPAQKFYYG